MAVAVYCRVSSEDQAERGTIEIQKDFAAKYVNLYNLDVFDYYCDDGVTGTLPLEMRPEGKRLLEDAANKRFNTVIFHKLDRLGRKVRVILNAVHDLDEFDVSIKSMTEPFETETPTGKFLLTTLAGIAELDRDTILARMWSGAQLAAKQGRWLGGIVPYGYHVIDKHLVVSDEPIPGCRISEEDVVNIIFDMAAKQKASCRQIADYLNAMNIPTKYVIDGIKGKRLKNTANYWYPSRILSIITSTTYKGLHVYGKRATHKHSKLITRPVPPIVSERIWERANEAVKENRIESMRNTKREYLLRSLIRCARCGHAYVGASYQKGKPFYVCSGKNKYKYLASERCTASNIRVDWLDNVVWQRCLEFLENPEKIYEAKSCTPAPEEQKGTSELEILKEQMRGILNEKEILLDLYRKKIITEQDLSVQISKLYADEESLNKQLQIKKDSQPKATLKQSKNAVVTILKDFISTLKDVKPSELPFELKRQVIKMLVDKIVIDCKTAPDKFYPDINVAIIWRFDAENVNLNYINNFTVKRDVNKIDKNYISGQRIRMLRMHQGLSVRQLAKLINIAPSSLSGIERVPRLTSIKTIKRIAEVLNAPVSYIGAYETLPERTLQERMIKAIRYRGMTKREAAELLGVNVKTIYNFLYCRSNIQPAIIEKFEKFIAETKKAGR